MNVTVCDCISPIHIFIILFNWFISYQNIIEFCENAVVIFLRDINSFQMETKKTAFYKLCFTPTLISKKKVGKLRVCRAF